MTLTLLQTPSGRYAKSYDHFSDLAGFDLGYAPRHLAVSSPSHRRARLRAIAVSAGLTLVGVGFLALAAAQTIGGAR